jgi:hypothetical protein
VSSQVSPPIVTGRLHANQNNNKATPYDRFFTG